MPFTSQPKSLKQSTHSLFPANEKYGLTKDSYLLGECIRQASERRIIKKMGTISENAGREEVKRVSEKYGLAIDADAYINELSVGMQQRVEILKILFKGANCSVP
jgi:ABC-type uncharacterized transport system ATPase subunit